MNHTRQLHTHIRMKIELALGGRSWNWLSRTAGVAQSTLASQATKPKFSVQVLVGVAAALEKDVNYFLPEELKAESGGSASEDVIDRIADIIWHARRGDPHYRESVRVSEVRYDLAGLRSVPAYRN